MPPTLRLSLHLIPIPTTTASPPAAIITTTMKQITCMTLLLPPVVAAATQTHHPIGPISPPNTAVATTTPHAHPPPMNPRTQRSRSYPTALMKMGGRLIATVIPFREVVVPGSRLGVRRGLLVGIRVEVGERTEIGMGTDTVEDSRRWWRSSQRISET